MEIVYAHICVFISCMFKFGVPLLLNGHLFIETSVLVLENSLSGGTAAKDMVEIESSFNLCKVVNKLLTADKY